MNNLQNYDDVIDSPIGFLGVKFTGQVLSKLVFLGRKPISKLNITSNNKQLSLKLKALLDGYFQNPNELSQPQAELNGTDFQKKVWQLLLGINPGQTRTYGDIAKELSSSPRAVGNACRHNPVPIFIPCHRVVSMSGRGGFMGHTDGEPMAIKEWLLAHEKMHCNS